jgi:hypothetical protein
MAESIQDLREIQSLTSSIAKTYDNINTSSDRRNRKIQQEVDLTKRILSSIQDEESLEKSLLRLKQRQNKISETNYGVNQRLKDILLETNQLAIQSLTTKMREMQILQRVRELTDEVGKSFKDNLSTIQTMISDIPLIGKFLQKFTTPGFEKMNTLIDRGIRGFGVGFERQFRLVRAQGGSFTSAFTGGFSRGISTMGGSVATLAKSFVGPQLIIAAIVGALALGVARFMEIGAAAKSFRQSTGLLNSQTKQTKENIASISRDFAGLGVNASDVADAAAEFTNTFSGLEQPAKSTLESMVVMNKNFGVSLSDAAELNKLFQNMGGLTEDQAQSLSMSVVEMSDLAGVAPSKVIADLAKNSGKAYEYFRGSPQELAKAAVSLAAMGSSLESATKSSEALLNFESSITSELEANALLGARINLDKARAAAFSGDVYGQEKAIMEQMAQIGDISKMDVFRKQALAKATGKEIGELENLQRIQERFPGIDEDRLASVNALLDAGKDISKLTTADLDAQTKRMALDKEMQGSISNMTNKISEMGTAIMDAFLPLAKVAIPIISWIVDMFGGFVKGIIEPIGNAFNRIFEKLKPLGDLWNKVFGGSDVSFLSKTFEVIGNILSFGILFAVNYLYGTFQSIVDVVSGLADIIMGIVTLDFSRMGKGFLSVFEGVLGFIYRIPMALFRTFMDIFPTLGTAFTDFFTGIAGSLKSFFTDMLPDWAKDWISGNKEGVESDTSAAQKQALDGTLGTDSSGYKVVDDSINDGVIQNGNVISTSPEDFLIATKNPADLANSTSGVSSGAINELISEIKALRADLLSGKIGVNMDGKKVTNGISKVVSNTSSNSYALR